MQLYQIPSRFSTLAVHHICLSSCNNMNPRSHCTHSVVSGFLFCDTTYYLSVVLFALHCHKFGTHYLLAFKNLSHFLLLDVTSRCIIFRRTIWLLSDSPTSVFWFFKKAWMLYKFLLTYFYIVVVLDLFREVIGVSVRCGRKTADEYSVQ